MGAARSVIRALLHIMKYSGLDIKMLLPSMYINIYPIAPSVSSGKTYE